MYPAEWAHPMWSRARAHPKWSRVGCKHPISIACPIVGARMPILGAPRGKHHNTTPFIQHSMPNHGELFTNILSGSTTLQLHLISIACPIVGHDCLIPSVRLRCHFTTNHQHGDFHDMRLIRDVFQDRAALPNLPYNQDNIHSNK